MRLQPLGPRQGHRRRPDRPQALGGQEMKVLRFMKSSTFNPEENRALRDVGNTWFGPAT